MLSKTRDNALHNANIDHPGHAIEHMYEYIPWWCDYEIWGGMCVKWRDEKWKKKQKTASENRVVGGEKAKGTYKGGSISQLQHITNKVCVNSFNIFIIMKMLNITCLFLLDTGKCLLQESESQGTPINWLDVYVATRDGLPDAVKIAVISFN